MVFTCNKGNLSILISTVLIFILQDVHIQAFCPGNFRGEGSVIFYWREKEPERKDQMRNWGLLEKELEENRYKDLTKYFDPKYVYAYTVSGDCCWEIWNETSFRGASAKLSSGFSGIPGFPQFNANSMKKVPC